MRRVERALAKVNLGLEILSRRDDGFHEVRSILCAISLSDSLTFDDAEEDEIVITGADDDIPREGNLVVKALETMRQYGALVPPQRVVIEKAIPAAAGLGGASTDAAAALRAFSLELANAGVDANPIASELGSDVPFFLGSQVALASGRGEILTSLSYPDPAWVVLVTPRIEIPDKTRTMYAAVDRAWWSDGSQVEAIAQALPRLPAAAPFNVFEEALLARFPEASVARDKLLAAASPFAALTGAGPTFYTLVASRSDAERIAARAAFPNLVVNVAKIAGHHG